MSILRGHHFKYTFLIIVLLALSVASIVRAQGDVDISLSADRELLTIGDPLLLTLSVTHPPGDIVIVPRLPETWGDFEVRSQSQTEESANADGSITTQQTIEVALFAPGTFETLPFNITVRDALGDVTSLTVPTITINVSSVLRQGDFDLRDIKPQADLFVPPLWPWIAGTILIVGSIGWSVYRWRRRRREREMALLAQIDPRTPLQIALDELAHIEGLDLPGQGRYKEHYTLVSDCLRQYLEAQHRLPATDRTTDELRMTLKHSPIDSILTRGVLDVLNDSDLVKFAKFIPAASEACAVVGRCRQLVEALEPRPIGPIEAPVEIDVTRERVA